MPTNQEENKRRDFMKTVAVAAAVAALLALRKPAS